MAREIQVPFWTVDADVIIPTRLLGKEHYAARTIRPDSCAIARIPQACGQSEGSSAVENVL